jgi:exonuclease SbcC
MIPIELEIGGLHSYRDPVTVDFDEAVEDGLFGIFGPTGSGKSTLLDAMTLALYDRVDRLGGREKTPMMNVDADELTVTYTFELGGTTYQAHRRWVRSGDGAQQRDAELRNLDRQETIASQAREMTAAVEQRLGMDFEQFTRAVFLPQGKFARFLDDNPKKRLELLEEIFGLDRYGDQLRQRARDKREQLQQEHDRIQGSLEGEMSEVTEDAVETLAQRTREAKQTIEDLTERERALAEDAQRARTLLDTLEDLEQARDQRAQLAERADDIETKRKRLARAEDAHDPHRTLQDLEDARDKLAGTRSQLEALEADREDAQTELEEARQAREDGSDELDTREAELDEARTRLEALATDADRLDDLREDRRRAQRTLDELDEATPPPESLDEDDLQAALDTIQAGQRAGDRRARHERDRRDALEARGEARCELAEIDETTDELAAEADEVADELAETDQALEDARVQDRAAVLGAHLAEGEPCPVCGSHEHPDPVEEPETPIADLEDRCQQLTDRSEEIGRERTRLAERRQQAADRLARAREDAHQARQALAQAREQVDDHRQRLPEALAEEPWKRARETVKTWRSGLEAQAAQATIEEIGESLETARARFALVRDVLDLDAREPTEDNLEGAREELEQAVASLEEGREQLDAQVEEADDAVDEIEDELGQVRGRCSTLAEQTQTLEERLAEQLADTPFEDADELAGAHEPAAVRHRLEDEIESFEEKRRQVQATIDQLEDRADGTDLDAGDADDLIDEHEQVEAQLGQAREHHGKLSERLETQRKRLERKRELAEQLDATEEKLTRAQRLTRLLGARRFIEYLARSRFDTVLEQASQRLAQISGGQYRLEGTPSDIHVVDLMAGGEDRDLRTLSGGETFMVSLSLALALSDAIQHQRGGGYPPIEFFFLDEGFGSLDGDRLDQVMRMLHELVDQDVRVGLITHVEEAQRYVPRKVLVEEATEEHGSSVTVTT